MLHPVIKINVMAIGRTDWEPGCSETKTETDEKTTIEQIASLIGGVIVCSSDSVMKRS